MLALQGADRSQAGNAVSIATPHPRAAAARAPRPPRLLVAVADPNFAPRSVAPASMQIENARAYATGFVTRHTLYSPGASLPHAPLLPPPSP